ncbi:hypothetical protein [Paenibacillus tarimensis]|uniref:hypothetical protein n=1 Tax=Paenibacillus tarimensis TaxID=416012 RepID=UPI001F45CCA6|nr:hypothetical protein [Paenibacillus tarimensis]MCF2946419.1 hypothetical protein [Paenibacillus tarimensis]
MNSINWTSLDNQEDLNKLLDAFGWFHDACIREMHMWTDHYVNPNLSMSIPVGLDHKVRLLLQRQARSLPAIELFFEQVTQVYIKPSPENYDSIIYESTFIHKNGLFYWADDRNWSPGGNDLYGTVNWISSRKVSWRDASDWIGHTLRYGPREHE